MHMPTMPMTMLQMTFHWSTEETLLFESWQTTGPVSFLLSSFIILVAAAGMQILRFTLSLKPGSAAGLLLYGVHTTTSFLLMLLAMTFNTGIFLAIILGSCLGHALCPMVSEALGVPCNEDACSEGGGRPIYGSMGCV